MMHPRRLKGKSANIARYYTIGDYYTKGADEHSEWGGRLASAWGLEGPVDRDAFQRFLAGQVNGEQVGRRRSTGEIEHHPGWDFAISAPKSVSIMALVAGDERILAAHERAVTVALDYLEEHAALRFRSGGEVKEVTTGRLLYARFTEHASRELDPHLHTHVVVMNLTSRDDGARPASLETRAMYAEQMTSGQAYRNELAHLLRELGYEIEVDHRRGLFEIKGVPHSLIERMSLRSAQIDQHAAEHGLSGQAARRVSFYETRGAKPKATREGLKARWDAGLGKDEPSLTATLEQASQPGQVNIEVDRMLSARAMLFGLRQSDTREAVNNLGLLLRTGLASHVGEVRLSDIRPLVEDHQHRAKLLITRHQTGDDMATRGRTLRRTARLEMALSDHLALAIGDAQPIAADSALRDAAALHRLSPDQLAALQHIGNSHDRAIGLQGVGGAGKSTIIGALQQAVGENPTLLAIAPTSSAAAELGAKAEIPSRTVASLLASGGVGLGTQHTLVIDEAGQLGNRQALRLLEISRETGARIIFLGDTSQTGAIEQGKPFWLMQRLGLPTFQLLRSMRQETGRMHLAVTLARAKDYAGAIANLDKVVIAAESVKLASALVDEWTRLKPENRDRTNILVLDNASRLAVNSLVRTALRREGVIAADERQMSVLVPAGMTEAQKRLARFYDRGQILIFRRYPVEEGIDRDVEYRVVGTGEGHSGREIVRIVAPDGKEHHWDPRRIRSSRVAVFREEQRNLAVGDRIQWRLITRELDLRNAERGTVVQMDGGTATIRWDRGCRLQVVELDHHRTWDHGFSETIYSAQSKTYDRVFVLAPSGAPLVTGQNFYTAITRARFGVKLWTENLDRLVERLSRRSGEKTSALEGLGRIDIDRVATRTVRHSERVAALRDEQRQLRHKRVEASLIAGRQQANPHPGLAYRLAGRAQQAAKQLDRWVARIFQEKLEREPSPDHVVPAENRSADIEVRVQYDR